MKRLRAKFPEAVNEARREEIADCLKEHRLEEAIEDLILGHANN